MIARIAAALLVVLALPAFGAETARILYLGLADDPYYEPQPVYTGLSLRDRHRPVDGARAAMRGTRVLSRALGLDFALEETLLGPGDDPVAAVRTARDEGVLAVLLDLPAEEMAAVAAAEGAEGLLFNIRHRAARWRGEDCAPALLHTIPSDAMLAEALAQYLRFRGWPRVLLLRGDAPEDAAGAEAARAAAAKFGLEIVAERDFALTNDPRRRELSNVALLTGGVGHDVIWLIDSAGEFGRYVPYATYAPSPVVGSEGLTPRAWHWTWERHGAPQLNQRFRRAAGRDMSSEDWAAWVAVRAVVDAVARLGAPDPQAVAAAVRGEDFAVDLYKGERGSFRPWNGQLRQPILLATHNAVIARAPLPGFEHEVSVLDTLGVPPTRSACRR